MDTEKKWLKFRGFHPSDFTRCYLGEKLSMLHAEAPYGSIMNAEFVRNGKSVRGKISISSKAGQFIAIASGRKLKEVNNKLLTQIRKKLEKWKKRRFRNDRLSQPLDISFNTKPDAAS
ncbi:MAG: hypothetical protein H6626_06865 [Pseudobdellovibrionaceae bacterium]|nr:hypothetical protein [Bdellovibrionales bacterium]USN48804.1 MAG: hypothetical protein H6626_06865 [Pseudobdellovibrionaceae bacterium]